MKHAKLYIENYIVEHWAADEIKFLTEILGQNHIASIYFLLLELHQKSKNCAFP